MDVSHFELVYKPQSPVPPADTVLQGYFLEISNLEDKAYQYQLEFVTSSVSDPDRSLFANTVVFVDVPGVNNQGGVFSLSGGLTSKSFRLNRFIEIPAHGTALVALLPSDPFSMPGGAPPVPNFECRGYVKLTLPALRVPGGAFFQQQRQSTTPVKVMLTPQNRATYLSATGRINDQTQSSVPVASGKALNLLEPGAPFSIFDRFELAEIEPVRPGFGLIDTRELITGLMESVAAEPDGMARFNAILAEAGVTMAVEGRAPAGAKGRKTEKA